MYQKPEILDSATHAQLSYTPQDTWEFARGQSTVPLVAEELAEASAFYPIVFPVDGGRPLALLGLRQKNVFIDEAGRWSLGYIPAFIRRYPFVLGQTKDDSEQFHLAADVSAPHFAGQGEPLFVGTAAGATATSAMSFLTSYQTAANRTEAAHKALYEAGVIQPKNLSQQVGNEQHVVGGFGVVDQEKLNALPDETLALWARNGLLATVYTHWASLRHLEKIAIASSRPETTN